jgi:hypothetical protein
MEKGGMSHDEADIVFTVRAAVRPGRDPSEE